MTFEEYKERYRLTGLTPRQEEAIKRAQGQTLLLAVPGSGKTTVTVARLGYMVKCLGLSPKSFLTLTYTTSACRDMKERYEYYFAEEDVPEFRTIHGICALIIQYYEKARKLRALKLLCADGEVSEILEGIYSEIVGKTPTPNNIRELKTCITYAVNMMLSPEEAEKQGKGCYKFTEIFYAYQEYKQSAGIMDYDDQLSRAYEILSKNPDVLEYFSDKFRYISVDEAQDTSRLQHEIIRLLSGKHGNIFMVGDEDQSIYGFRAAYPEALLEFDKTYPGGKILFMEENFRSTGEIVSSAMRLIGNNRKRRRKNMITSKATGERIKLVKLDDYENQAPYLLEICKGVMKEKESTAILFRNNASALPIIDLLLREDIPYKYRENDGLFFSCSAVSDMLLMLEFCENPQSEELFLRVCPLLGCGISYATAKAIAQRCKSGNSDYLSELLCEASYSKQTHSKTAILCSAIKHLKGKSAYYSVKTLYNDTCFGKRLRKLSGDGNQISVLLALAKHYGDNCDFLNGMKSLENQIKNYSEPQDKCIVLSTVHSSKGLEYDNVIIIDAKNGVFPGEISDFRTRGKQENALEEERRLFYVALTRARKSVKLIFCKREFGTPCARGIFLRECTRDALLSRIKTRVICAFRNR